MIMGDNMKFTLVLRCLLAILMTILLYAGGFVWYIYLLCNAIALSGCRLVFNSVILDPYEGLFKIQ